jgi:hypothetical protein
LAAPLAAIAPLTTLKMTERMVMIRKNCGNRRTGGHSRWVGHQSK